jgi:hypothetical protein
MNLYKRPEKETDPDKYPGVVNYREPPSGREKMKDGCCHQTVLAGQRCSDCSFRDPQTGSIGSPPKHDWAIWPETDGLVQRCRITGEYRDTPEEDKFWKRG